MENPDFIASGSDLGGHTEVEGIAAAKSSHCNYAQIVSLSLDAIFVVDCQYRLQFANQVYLDWLGQPIDAVLEQPLSTVTGEEEFEQLFRAPLVRCFQGERFQIETWAHYPQLGWQFISFTYAPQLEPNRQISGAIISQRNLTALKQIEATLNQQAERERIIATLTQQLRQSFDLSDILTAAVNLVQDYLQTDRVIIVEYLETYKGRLCQEAVMPHCSSLGPNPRNFDFTHPVWETFQRGEAVCFSNLTETNFSPRHVEFWQSIGVKSSLAIPIFVQKQLWGLLAAHTCQLERSWSDHEVELLTQLASQLGIALHQSKLVAQLREQAMLLDIATDAIVVRDLKQRICYWNRGAETLYGWSAQEAIGKNINQLLYRQVPTQVYMALETVLKAGQWQGELEKVSKSGRTITVSSRWTLVQETNKESKLILMVDTDITEKKHLEAQFLRTQRLESIGTLAGGMAHDLNNLLTPVLMATQLLQRRLKDSPTQDLLQILETNTKRGAALVQQVLTFARGIEGRRAPLQLDSLLADISLVISHTFPPTIQVEFQPPPVDLWQTPADVTQIHQVLMNLCLNARDAMREGGKLRLEAINLWVDLSLPQCPAHQPPGPYVVIKVIDTGTGITPEVQARMFEPFFTTKGVGQGTGLGLPTVLGIVSSHNGFLTVDTQVGQGSTFTVYLPAQTAAAPASDG